MRTDSGVAVGGWSLPLPLTRALRDVALVLIAAIAAGLAYLVTATDFPVVATLYFIEQDLWWLILAILFRWVLILPRSWHALQRPMSCVLGHPRVAAAAIALAVLGLTFAGTTLVHQNFNLTNDENMAAFDSRIFRHGLLMAPLPEDWRPLGAALLPAFGYPIADHAAWVSVYLPGNAAFRAVVDLVAAAQLANPLLAALSIAMIYSIARQLWPDRPDAAVVGALLLATSTQFLLMATNGFAMTGHLALNLLWLRLFLRSDRLGHAGAMVIGFVACGWHQLVFHPLLVAPFVLHLWWERRWRPALAYTLAYSAIGLFWINYWQLAAFFSGVALAGAGSSAAHFAQNVRELFGRSSGHDLALMGFNLLRFVAWQNPLTIPLVLVGLRSWRHCPVPLRLAGSGLCLAIVAIFILLPEQGQGWGYRYLHGFIGVACLLAAQGWISMSPADPKWEARAWAAPGVAALVVLLVQLPGQSLQVRTWIDPFVKSVAAVQAAPADIVVIDKWGIAYAHRFVRNDPFLNNRPIVLWLPGLTEPQIESLCSRGSRIRVFDQSAGKKYGVPTFEPAGPSASADEDRARSLLRSLPCVSSEVL